MHQNRATVNVADWRVAHPYLTSSAFTGERRYAPISFVCSESNGWFACVAVDDKLCAGRRLVLDFQALH